MEAIKRLSSSFRDPSGYVYEQDGIIYRKISEDYRPVVEKFVSSGLYKELTDRRAVLPFRWVEDTLIPEQVPFISYPYEWSFSMLKDAALLTLSIQHLSLEYGMQLKDASAYNIQFVKGRPVLIDHLSFYPYTEGEPWVAYSQFCRHFLAPLALMAYKKDNFIRHLQLELDGLKLGHSSHLLPFRAYLKPGLLMHLKLHGIDSKAVAPRPSMRISKFKLQALVKNLHSTVKGLEWRPTSGWKDYKLACNYTSEAEDSKTEIVSSYLRQVDSKVVADLGSNTGRYSRLASDLEARVISIDSDPACVELCYKENTGDILSLVIDLTNPSPSIGWEGTERNSFLSRFNADTILALALIHHLAIGNNLPLSRISTFLANYCDYLVIEFVPKEDSQVQKMLSSRIDIFPTYTKKGFEEAFSTDFSILDSKRVEGTVRDLYLMEVK